MSSLYAADCWTCPLRMYDDRKGPICDHEDGADVDMSSAIYNGGYPFGCPASGPNGLDVSGDKGILPFFTQR